MIYAENILLCIAFPLFISTLFVRGNARRITFCFLLGMGACLLGAYISGFIEMTSGGGTNETAVFVSPIIEEIMKILPLLFYLFLFNPEENSVFVASMGIGAGFATFENCCYILTAGAGSLQYIAIRGLAVGVMHISCAVLSAVVLIIARRYHLLTFATVAGSLAFPMIFHGLYNLLVSNPGITSWIGYVMPIPAALILYRIYRMTNIKETD